MQQIKWLGVALALTVSQAQASVIIPTDAASWGRAAGAADGTGTGGLLQTTTLTELLTKPDPNDPSGWVTNAESWTGDFQGQYVNEMVTAGTSPWIVYDLGDVYNLSTAYIMTNVEANRGFKSIELYYATDISSNQVTSWASASALPANSATSFAAYSFSAGGWTQFGTNYTLLDVNDGFGTQAQPMTPIDLTGIGSARYVGIRALSSFQESSGNPFGTASGTNAGNRAGINQIAFTGTAVPEPSTALLVALGMLSMLRRNRR